VTNASTVKERSDSFASSFFFTPNEHRHFNFQLAKIATTHFQKEMLSFWHFEEGEETFCQQLTLGPLPPLLERQQVSFLSFFLSFFLSSNNVPSLNKIANERPLNSSLRHFRKLRIHLDLLPGGSVPKGSNPLNFLEKEL